MAHVFVDALDDTCEITGDDGHHLQRVRRLAPGEIVTAADGSGAWRVYAVTEVGASALVLDARAPSPRSWRTDRIGVSLAVALTKGGLDDVVAAVTELGVRRVDARSAPRASSCAGTRHRARRRSPGCAPWPGEAAMQSRRARIPVIDDGRRPARCCVDRPGLVVAGPTAWARGVAAPAGRHRGARGIRATRGRCVVGPGGRLRPRRARAALAPVGCPAPARPERAAGGDRAGRGGRGAWRGSGTPAPRVTRVVADRRAMWRLLEAMGSMTFTERAVIMRSPHSAPSAGCGQRAAADVGSGRGGIELANTGARVGERLRAIRRQKGLSLHDVEARSSLEFKASVLGAYERGERAISVPRLLRLAEIYEVPADQLLPRELDGEISLVETGATNGIDLNAKFTIDLVRLHELDDPDAHILDRFATSLQRERQDFNGRMLTIRRSDLRVLASCMGRSLEELGSRLEQLGLRAAITAG